MQYFTIDITGSISSAVSALQHGVTSDGGKKFIGRAVMDVVRTHFSKLNAERHHSWAKGIGFYEQAARGTHIEVVPDGVEVITDKTGLDLRIAGGIVTPGKNKSCKTGKPTQYLTIPAIAEAYGRGACDFDGLQFVKFGKGENAPAALIEKKPKSVTWFSSGKKVRNLFKQSKNQQGAFGRRVWFWLVKSTSHKPDPSVLPDPDAVENAALAALEKYAANFT